MFLFILESLGTQELILIGIMALIFLGPRRLPEIARKIGKVMADLRGTANEFRSTWEKEVDFEEETKALRLDVLEEEAEKPIARENSISNTEPASVELPAVRQVDKESFDAMTADANASNESANGNGDQPLEEPDLLSDKRNWL